jgi:hypothetical protein
MGTGVNVQVRVRWLHHADAPWRPADVRQRDGRGIRQGNGNDEVGIVRYVTEQSFDTFMWQTLTRKARFIAQIMRGEIDEAEDISDTALSYQEVMALATGEPLILEKAQADADLAKLERAARAHNREQSQLDWTVRYRSEGAEGWRRTAASIDGAIGCRDRHTAGTFEATVDGTTYSKRAEAGRALAAAAQTAMITLGRGMSHRKVPVGWLAGFKVTVTVTEFPELATFSLEGVYGSDTAYEGAQVRAMAYDVQAGGIHAGLISRLEHRLAALEGARLDVLEQAAMCDREVAHARASIGAPFRRASELSAARDRAAGIDTQLAEAAERGKGDEASAG